jgi:hypothetical protein
MRFGEAPAQRVGHAAQLLPHHHLIQHRQRQPAAVERYIHPRQTQLAGDVAMSGLDVLRQFTLVELGRFLVRDQFVFGEGAGAALPFDGLC